MRFSHRVVEAAVCEVVRVGPPDGHRGGAATTRSTQTQRLRNGYATVELMKLSRPLCVAIRLLETQEASRDLTHLMSVNVLCEIVLFCAPPSNETPQAPSRVNLGKR